MRVLPKWAMMFSVCVPVIGQLIFLYIIYTSYVNLQFIRPETTRSLVKDFLLVALTGGLFVLFLIPLFFREVSLGAQRMNVQLPNYTFISIAFMFTTLLIPTIFYVFSDWIIILVWFVSPLCYTYLLISPFEKIQKEYEPYL